MRHRSGHFSCYRAFLKVRIWHNASQYVSKGPGTPRGAQIYFMSSKGSSEALQGWYNIYIYIYTYLITPRGSPWTPSNSKKEYIWPPFGCTKPFGDILGSIESNSHFGKRSAARDMTIFSFHFLPNGKFTNSTQGRWLPKGLLRLSSAFQLSSRYGSKS